MSANAGAWDRIACDGKIVALCGGVGGAKLAWGLAQILESEQLTIVVNTGDDFEHLGFHISPDLDTVMYTLAGINNRELGWGLQGESWQCMQALEQLGGETWFRLGDRDIATHLRRTQLLKSGESLTAVTQQLCEALGVRHRLLPMCNQPVRTVVETDEGDLAFQHYFVREQCRPRVRGLRYVGEEHAQLSPEVMVALTDPAVRAVIVCPSNPLLSIAPILSVPGMRDRLQSLVAPVLVVSPLVGGQAVKGPTAKMMQELGMDLHSVSVAGFYADMMHTLVIDEVDVSDVAVLQKAGVRTQVCKTLMLSDADRIDLATRLVQLVRGHI